MANVIAKAEPPAGKIPARGKRIVGRLEDGRWNISLKLDDGDYLTVPEFNRFILAARVELRRYQRDLLVRKAGQNVASNA